MSILFKICYKCQKKLPEGAFYSHPKTKDGKLGKCKECAKKDSTQNRTKNILRVQEYDRRRGNRVPKEMRDARNKARRTRVRNTCTFCGSSDNIEKHHPDYNDGTKVVGLCRKCHRNLHTIIKIKDYSRYL